MKKIIATALLPLMLAMSACGTGSASPTDGPGNNYQYTDSSGNEGPMESRFPDDAVEIEIPGENIYIYTIKMENGETCYASGYKGGIWCEDGSSE